jgi:AraC family transcriptional regulator of adaptative response/methylated-DNA-[protein]-cysteine methyltransferase
VNSAQQKQARAATILRDPRWTKLSARDASADGTFCYAVRTTGVYCRPSCASRLPRPDNVLFYSSTKGARRAGFRPCRRCQPDEASGSDDIRYAIGKCSLGSILVAQSRRGICGILLGDDPEALARDLQARFPNANATDSAPDLGNVVMSVVRLIEAPAFGLDLPLDLRGTAFQRRVWQALRRIRRGETASYREIAARIGAPKAVRAVAQACGANGLAVAIPCHRVIRSDGGLSGYRWGQQRKQALLQREARA